MVILMEEEKSKKDSTLYSSNKSNRNNNKKKTVKKEPSFLSSEELLEQILSKKKAKQIKKKVSKSELENSRLKNIDNRSNEEILEEILAKKRKKKVKGIVPSTDVDYPVSIKAIASYEKEKPENKQDVDNHLLLQEIIEAVQKEEKKKEENKKFLFHKKVYIGVLCCLLLFCIGLSTFFLFRKTNFQFIKPKDILITYDNRPILFENCMQDTVYLGSTINEKMTELNDFLSSTYKASISYEDITSNYQYNYRENQLYYAASTIKALDALYIYTHASFGELSLDTTMTYSSKYKRSSSKGLSTYKYGSKITLRELVKYAVEVSDNSAHIMLLDYIGEKNLKDFGVSIGASNTLSLSDSFGYLSSSDGLSIMRGVYNFIVSNEELGKELQSYFLNAEQNDLEIPSLEIKAAHKYGEYGSVYHDMGIVYDKYPYIVAIFTSEGNKSDHEDIVRDIHNHIYVFHKSLYEEKESVCRSKIYK